jgi:hypothetical protein
MLSENDPSVVNLAELAADELREVMYARLQGNLAGGPAVDPRVGPAAFEWLGDEYQRADAGTQHRMTAILRDFLCELTDTQRWPEPARWALLDLIQDCGEALVDDLYRMIRQRALLDAEGLGPDAHAGLLKCLISNGHHATPEFWLDQSQTLGPAYGALIFSGLIDHGLELAMSHLPQLSSEPEARTYIRWVFPHLKDRYGTSAVVEALERQRARLPDETYRLYRDDLVPPQRLDPPAATPADGGALPPVESAANSQVASTLQRLIQGAKQRVRTDPREYTGLFAA